VRHLKFVGSLRVAPPREAQRPHPLDLDHFYTPPPISTSSLPLEPKGTTWSSLFHLLAARFVLVTGGCCGKFGECCVILLLWKLWIWVDFAVC
jgi:hypothetical protein